MDYPGTGGLMMRRVRSFVRRQGRMSEGQRRMLDLHWRRYGIEHQDGVLDLDQIFARRAPRIIEIGFGMGGSLLQMARSHPQHDFLGIEVHRPGIASLLRGLEQQAISNVRVICDDAVTVLERNIAQHNLSAVYLYFPDPWPKLRHHKRRIVQPAFVELVASRLQAGGVFHMATDWEQYAEQALTVLSDCPLLVNRAGEQRFSERPEYRPLTKFEQRGQRLGHAVHDLIFERRVEG